MSMLLGNYEEFAQYVPVHVHVCNPLQLMSIKTFGMERELKNNLLLKTESSSVGLILYQDAFEVVNPLGSENKQKKQNTES